MLAEYGLAADAPELNRRSAELARQAADEYPYAIEAAFRCRCRGADDEGDYRDWRCDV